ncbi:MAG TPA: alpha-mannosidase, partial [Firmicutes bacterium]|nr:alpha-mannosidase [Bacillota bacterium]
VSLFDKEAKREVIPQGQVANELQAFEDRPMNYDAWDIDLYYQEKQYPVDELSKWEVLEDGPDRVVVGLEWKFLDSTIRQRISVYAESRAIDFATEIDWQEHSILLKAAFPVAVRSTKATYEIQYGNVERPTHYNTSWDWAKFETVAQKWVDLSERNYGVSLLNDCKYGHDIKNNVMRLTLLKSAIEPDPQADQGLHQFTYGLLPHQGDWYEAKTTQAGYELNFPLRGVISSSAQGTLASSGHLLQVESESTILDTVKKAEDSQELVLRFYEFGNRTDQISVTFPHTLRGVRECNLMEKADKDVEFQGNRFTFTLNPYEIRTFKIK